MQKPFIVIHERTGQRLLAYDDTQEGFLHLVPLYPSIGISGSPAYILKKPFWRRMLIHDTVDSQKIENMIEYFREKGFEVKH